MFHRISSEVSVQMSPIGLKYVTWIPYGIPPGNFYKESREKLLQKSLKEFSKQL